MLNNNSNIEKNINNSDSYILFRKRVLTNLIVLPIFLLTFGILGFMMWNISLIWATLSESIQKTLFGISGMFILLLELFLAFIFLLFTRWVYTGQKGNVLKIFQEWAFFTSVDHSTSLKNRKLTMLFLLPVLLIVDGGLIVLILTTILVINKSSIIHYLWTDWLFLTISSLIDIFGLMYLVYFHIKFIDWVVKGRPVISQSK